MGIFKERPYESETVSGDKSGYTVQTVDVRYNYSYHGILADVEVACTDYLQLEAALNIPQLREG